MVRNQGRVTRFVVMAMLQAARAEALGLPHRSALSWGLNRAIFYAAAKRGFRGGGSETGAAPPASHPAPNREAYPLGDDEALRDLSAGELLFTIGDETQTPEAFEAGVAARFGTAKNFDLAWKEALRIVGEEERGTLESRQRFYDQVYRPRRDELSDRWTQEYSPPPSDVRPRRSSRTHRPSA